MMKQANGKKVTLATVKAFMRRNAANLMVKATSSFDGMYDCVMPSDNPAYRCVGGLFRENNKNTYGLPGVWFVGGSGNWFSPITEPGLTGYRVSNCCGSFSVAVPWDKVR